MDEHESVARWYALRVKSRREHVVASAIRRKGFEEFLPLYISLKRWSDRTKSVREPLFPGYVFCRLDPDHRLPILTLPGALYFVSVGKTPVPLDDSEIGAIQTMIRSQLRVEPLPFLGAGQRVRLARGPLAGLEGNLIEVSSQHKIVVTLSLLRRSVAAEIERDWGAVAMDGPESNGSHCFPMTTESAGLVTPKGGRV